MFGLTGIEAARTCSVGRRESSDPFVFGNQGEGKGVMDRLMGGGDEER